jgi:hypothetical protein
MSTSGGADFGFDDAREYGASLCFAGVPLNTALGSLRSLYYTRIGSIRQSSALERAGLVAEQEHRRARLLILRTVATDREQKRHRLVTLRKLIASRRTELAALEAKIRTKRHVVEGARMSAALAELDKQAATAADRVTAERIAQHRRSVEVWEAAKAWREQQINELGRERVTAHDDVKTTESKITQLGDPLVTRTVAGFLLWVGYSSIAVIGAAVALILGKDADLSSAVLGQLLGSITQLLQATPAWVLPLIPIFLLVVVAAIGLVFWGFDWAIDHFDPHGWRNAKKTSTPEGGIPSFDLTRRSYVRVLTALPFLYVAGLLATVLCTAGRFGGNTVDPKKLEDALSAFSTSMANTLIGSVIALLLTSVFILYVIKLVERRSKGTPLKAAWEIAVLPVLLLIALGIALFGTEPTRRMWGAIAAFMLMSSLALAYGVVYRGLFREMDRARWRLQSIDDLIASHREPPGLSEPKRDERHALRTLARSYRREREWLEDIERERDLRRTFGLDDLQDIALFQRWLNRKQSVVDRLRATDAPPLLLKLRVLDSEAAEKEVEIREKLQREQSEDETETSALDDELRSTSREEENTTIRELEREIEQHAVRVAQIPFQEKQAIANLAEAYHRVMAEVTLGFETATSVKEAADEVKPELRPRRPRRVEAVV